MYGYCEHMLLLSILLELVLFIICNISKIKCVLKQIRVCFPNPTTENTIDTYIRIYIFFR